MLRINAHIISLAAVFLALGIGLFLGISLGEDILVENQIEIIAQMEERLTDYMEKFRRSEEKNIYFEEELKKWSELESKIFPYVFTGLLNNYDFALIYSEELPEDLICFLELTGCQFTTVRVISTSKILQTEVDNYNYNDGEYYSNFYKDLWSYLNGNQAPKLLNDYLAKNFVLINGPLAEEYSALFIEEKMDNAILSDINLPHFTFLPANKSTTLKNKSQKTFQLDNIFDAMEFLKEIGIDYPNN